MEKLNKPIFSALFGSIFTAVMGVGIVVPLLPVYAHDLGASGLYIGLIFGSFSLSRTIFLPYFGRISDRKGRKPFIVLGLFAYSLISLLFMLTDNVNTLIGVRFFQGIASAMIMPVAQAYVGDITPVGKEGITMGLFNMSIFLSLSIGPILGGVINDRFNLNISFLCMGLLAFAGFLMSYFFLPATNLEQIKPHGNQLIKWSRLIRDRDLAGLVIVRFTYTACIGILWGFLPIFADTAFSLSSSSIGILVTTGVFFSGLLQIPMGYLADRVNRKLMIFWGGMLTAGAIFSLNWADGFRDLLFANIAFGLGGGIAMPPIMALAVIKGNQTGAMGSVMALLTVAHSLGMLVGSLLAGFTMDLFQLREAFFLGAVMMSFGVASFLFFTHSGKMKEQTDMQQS